MEADAEHEQGTVHRDQNQSTRSHPNKLQRGAPLRRTNRKPRHASQNRDPEITQLTERSKGAIELQTHGSEIRFRNIYVREIPPDEAKATLAKAGG